MLERLFSQQPYNVYTSNEPTRLCSSFRAFSATTAHCLATHVSMIHTVKRPEVLQADKALRERAQAPST